MPRIVLFLPRRPGVDKDIMSAKTLTCFKCRHVWTFQPPLERKAECPKCSYDAHVCLNCRHYDQGAHHECREEQAEWVKEKDRSNFCSWFEPGSGQAGADAANAKGKLDALFGGPKPEAPKPGASVADELAKFLAGKK